MLIQEKVALSTRITAILTKHRKRAQCEGCVKTKMICTYKRRREKKEKTHKKFKRIQFLIEGKG